MGIFLSIAVAMACIQTAAQADMTIREYESHLHDRFYTGEDKDFIGADYNWSGVGKTDDNRWVTMVSSRYFLSAAHYSPSDTVTFFAGNSNSDPHVHEIDSGQQISPANQTNGTDLWLGKLTQPVDSTISSYPVLGLSNANAYLGMELYNYGQENRVGRNELEKINYVDVSTSTGSTSTGMSMIFDYEDNDAAETWLKSRDSGGPSFTVWNGKLALLGIHWFATHPSEVTEDTEIQSGDTFVPSYIGDVNLLMNGESAESAESLTVVPEPGTISLGLLALIGLALIRKRLFRG